MASILIALLYIVLVLVSVFLIFVVLLQRANTNAGLGTAFGGGIAESAFGAETGNLLTRCTIGAAVAFFIVSFGLYLIYIGRASVEDVMPGGLPDVGLIQAGEPAESEIVNAGEELPDGLESLSGVVELSDAVKESALATESELSEWVTEPTVQEGAVSPEDADGGASAYADPLAAPEPDSAVSP